MSAIKQLREIFENDKAGYIFINELNKITSSAMLISGIARQYGYYPYHRNNKSTRIIAYVHHTVNFEPYS